MNTHVGNDLKSIEDMPWCHTSLPTASKKDCGKEWIKRMSQLAPNKVLSVYNRNNDLTVPNVHGSIHIFPAKNFQSNRWDDCKWLAKASKILQNDEAVISLWRAKGNKVIDISKGFGIEEVKTFNRVKEIHNDKIPYIAHMLNCVGTMEEELLWRKHINAL